jgi:branched-chain amino acid transport system substrate-binding protein
VAVASVGVYGVDPNMFPNSSTSSAAEWAYVKSAQLIGKDKLGLLYCSELAVCAMIPDLEKPWTTGTPVSIVKSMGFSESAPNYTAQCLALQSAGVDILSASSGNPTVGLRVVQSCAQQGYIPAWELGGPDMSPQVISANLPNEIVILGNTIPYFVKNSSTAAFHQAMDSYLPSSAAPMNVMTDWVGMQVIGTAAKFGVAAGTTPTSQAFYNGLYQIKNNTIGGLTAPLTYTQGKGTVVPCSFFSVLNHGQLSTPYGTSAQCYSSAPAQ